MNPLKIHFFQHVHYEGIGHIEYWAISKGHVLSSTHFYKDFEIPNLENIDFLIVMGGPMGVYNEDQFPWLKTEKKLIDNAIKSKKKVLGICLGSQLIAEVLGAKVYHNTQKEIGWFPIQLTEEAKQSKLLNFLPDQFSVFHWHGDTFDLPVNTVRLSSSAATKNQAFSYGDHVLALQFHFEVVESLVNEIVNHSRTELVKSDFVQTEEEIEQGKVYYAENHKRLEQLLDRFTE